MAVGEFGSVAQRPAAEDEWHCFIWLPRESHAADA